MKVSARNIFAGKVRTVKAGSVNAAVEPALADSDRLVAIVTKEAVGEPGLKPGVAAAAVIKASHVVLGVQT